MRKPAKIWLLISAVAVVCGQSIAQDQVQNQTEADFPESITVPSLIVSSSSSSQTIITEISTIETESSSTFPKTELNPEEEEESTTTQIPTTETVGSENCTVAYISRFPKDLFTNRQRKLGALFLHIVLAIYSLLAVSLLVEQYFVPSLERLSEVVRLDEDITGATFMAAGSSAPEVFIAIIGSIYSNSDVGIGAVVGSAVFNILFVIGICAVLTPSVVKLSWWPFLRDSCYYCFSAIVLVLVGGGNRCRRRDYSCIMDGKIYWYESTLLLVLYAVYLVILSFNRRIQAVAAELIGKNALEAEFLLISDDRNQIIEGYERLDNRTTDYDSISQPVGLDDSGENARSLLNPPTTKSPWIDLVAENTKKYSMIPLRFCFMFTIPDCRQYKFRMLFPVTFVLSVVWLGVWCYLLVWMVATIGYTLNIPDSVMGITFLAAGTSLPDTLASIHAVKTGHVNMGVSNTIGSNLFDLLIALAVPWLIRNVLTKQYVVVNSRGLSIDTILLVGTVIAAVFSIRSKGYYLDRKLGTLLLGFYMIYLIISLMIELNVFGFVNLPACPI